MFVDKQNHMKMSISKEMFTIGGACVKSEKDDRRVRYTKMALKASFIKLLGEKDISKITIKEICEDADINRATFYAHYSDQYDLMHRIESELLDNVNSYLSKYTQKDSDNETMEMVEKIFVYIKDNAQLCKLLLSERGDLNFQKKIMMLAYEKNLVFFSGKDAVSRDEYEYVYSYTITGCVGVIQKWLDEDMPQSARFMAELLVKLSTSLLNSSFKKPQV